MRITKRGKVIRITLQKKNNKKSNNRTKKNIMTIIKSKIFKKQNKNSPQRSHHQ